MAIIKVKKKINPFVQIDKAGIEDSNLSWGATGLLTYLIGRPDNWSVNISHLSSVKKDKKASTTKALHELRNSGYVHYFEIRESGKIVENIYLVFEDITCRKYAESLIELKEGQKISYKAVATKKAKVSPQSDFPITVKPISENQTLIIKDINNKRNNNNILANSNNSKNFEKREKIKEILNNKSIGFTTDLFKKFIEIGHTWKVENIENKINFAINNGIHLDTMGYILIEHGNKSLPAFEIAIKEFSYKRGKIEKSTPKVAVGVFKGRTTEPKKSIETIKLEEIISKISKGLVKIGNYQLGGEVANIKTIDQANDFIEKNPSLNFTQL